MFAMGIGSHVHVYTGLTGIANSKVQKSTKHCKTDVARQILHDTDQHSLA